MAIFDSPVYQRTLKQGDFTADKVNGGMSCTILLDEIPELEPWLPYNHVHISNAGYQVLLVSLNAAYVDDRTRMSCKGRTIVDKFVTSYKYITIHSPAVLDEEAECTLILGRKVSETMCAFSQLTGVPLESVMRGEVRNPGKQ